MSRFSDIPIRGKQTLIMMLTSGIALLLACAAFLAYDLTAFRRELAEGTSTLADAIGNNCAAALDFNDAKTAQEALSALRAEPNIAAACIYDKNGEVFATYTRDNLAKVVLPPARTTSQEFTGDQLRLFRTLSPYGEKIGTIYVTAELDEFAQRLSRYLVIVGVVFLASLLVTFALSSRLQRVISGPIRNLADVARSVAVEKNYSLRAKKQGGDELGELVDRFNEMLAEIQERDFALQAARYTLEHSVEERTQELASSIALLNATLQASADGILAVDRRGHVTSYNQRFVEMWGLSSESMARRNTDELLALALPQVKNPEALKACFMALHESPESESLEVLEFHDGRMVERMTKPQYIGEKCTGTVITYRDITVRKRNELALRKSTERMRLQTAALESAANGVAITDCQGTIQWINPAFTKLTGYSAEEVIGRNPRVLKSGQHPESYYQAMWQTISTGHAWKGEIVNRRKSGQLYPEEMTITPVRDASGALTHFVAIKQDITERKRAEAALRESQTLYESLVSQLPQCILRKDLEGRFTFANQNFCRLLGKSPVEILGRTDFDLFPQDLAEKYRQDDQRVIQERQAREQVEQNIKANGDRTFVQVVKTPLVNAAGEVVGLQGIFWDITAHKQAEELLRRTEAVYRSAIAGAGAVPYALNFKTRSYDFVGDGIQQLIGYAPHEVNGDLWTKLIQKSVMLGEAAGADKNEAAKRVESGDLRHWRCDMLVTTRDGETRWISDASVQNLDEAGHVIGSVGILQDITERKAAEAELERTHRQLLDISRAAGMAEVATSVLHNVGNVLNSVNTSATMAADRLKNSKVDGVARVAELLDQNRPKLTEFLSADGRADQVVDYLKSLAQHLTAERASALGELKELTQNIDHIKEIVVMQQSYARVSGVTEKVKPTDLVEDALRMNAGALDRHQVELIREYDPGLPEIIVEKHKVLQILVNLIRNAKYACDDSQLTDKQLTVRVTNGDDRVRITVMDNGIGIPPENLTRIFSHGFTTRKNGHGFGLHSGALAAKELGGALLVHSDGPGKGANFTLELPVPPVSRLAALESFAPTPQPTPCVAR